MSKTHLVIPDSHAKPGVSNERYDWLGRFILDVKPDVVVNLGDMADMYSLNEYEKGTKGFITTANYKADVDAVIDAQERLWEPTNKYNKGKSRAKKRGYYPLTYQLIGNHENRILRALKYNPHLEGTISMEDLRYGEYNGKVVPYLTKVVIDGIVYCHCIQSGNSSMMMGGRHQANSMLMQEHVSVTVGHSHKKDYKENVNGYGKRIHGLVAGCYFEHNESYASQSNDSWWRGVVLKRGVEDGDYEPQFIKLDDLKREYSK